MALYAYGAITPKLCVHFKELTYGLIWKKWQVLKAIDLGDIIEIGMLYNKRPLSVVHSIVEIDDGNLDPPIVLVVFFNVPVHPDMTQVVCAS